MTQFGALLRRLQGFLRTFGCLKPLLLWALASWGSLSNGLMQVVRRLLRRGSEINYLQPANSDATAISSNRGSSGWRPVSVLWGSANYLFNVPGILELFQALNTRSYSVNTIILYRFSSGKILFVEVKNALPTLFIFKVAEEWSLLVHSYLLLYLNAHPIEIHRGNYAKIINYFTSFRVWDIQILIFLFDLHLWPKLLPHETRFAELLRILGLFWRYLLIGSSLSQSEGAIYRSWPTLRRRIGSLRRACFYLHLWLNSRRLRVIADNLISFTLYFRLLLLMAGPDLLFHLVILGCRTLFRWRSPQSNLWWYPSLLWRLFLFLLLFHNYKLVIIF